MKFRKFRLRRSIPSFANQSFAAIIFEFVVGLSESNLTIIYILNHLTFFPDSVYFPLTPCTSIASLLAWRKHLNVDEGDKQQQQTAVL